MFNPIVNLEGLSEGEIKERILALQQRQAAIARGGNAHLFNQISMLIDTHLSYLHTVFGPQPVIDPENISVDTDPDK